MLETFNHNILLGLDMMKRHRCVIDLKKNEMHFGLAEISISFLTDYQIRNLNMKRNGDKIKIVVDSLKISEGQALDLLERTHFDANEAIQLGLMSKSGMQR